jgi:hypothetical protein
MRFGSNFFNFQSFSIALAKMPNQSDNMSPNKNIVKKKLKKNIVNDHMANWPYGHYGVQ